MLELAIAVMILLPLIAFVDWKVIKEEKGAELVEFAVVLPLLMMVLFGMYWFARSFNIWETMTRAAREGAAYGARPHCALCGGGGALGQFPQTDTVINQAVLPSLNADHIKISDLAIIQQPRLPNCFKGQNTSACPVNFSGNVAPCEPYQGKIYVCRCVDMDPQGTVPGQACGVAVSMAYPWKWTLPFSGISNVLFTIPASSVQRQEY